MKQFWMVWRRWGGAPTHQHDTEEGAAAEAERLARLHPGETFVVLEAVRALKVSDIHTIDLRGTTDEIPF
jgi:hypothetical protein